MREHLSLMFEEKCLGLQIKIVSNLINRQVQQIGAHPEDKTGCAITGLHGWIISYLAENPDKDIYQKDIEQLLSIRRSSVTSTLQSMEKNGLIQRVSVSHDARLKKILLTKEGRMHYDCTRRKLQRIEAQLIGDIPEAELDQFRQTLTKLYQNMAVSDPCLIESAPSDSLTVNPN